MGYLYVFICILQHIHVHILPRKEGDFERNDDIYDKVRQFLSISFIIATKQKKILKLLRSLIYLKAKINSIKGNVIIMLGHFLVKDH